MIPRNIESQKKIIRIEKALKSLSNHRSQCRLCPRQCSVDREKEEGYCLTGWDPVVSHSGLHFGEEPILSGIPRNNKETDNHLPQSCGSGTIFFAGCHLKCLFCQNHQISWQNKGNAISTKKLSDAMLELQSKGALNINLVSPTHMLIPILSALKTAYIKGLSLPLVYNSSGYERAEVIKKLDGVVDLYLPDMKYFSPQLSKRLSGVSGYFGQAKKAIKEMADQQPHLKLEENETAQKGLIIRHLVLPGQVSNTLNILNWIKENIPLSIGLSLMSQFYPCFKTPPEFQRKITKKEYEKVLRIAQELGFKYIYAQPELFSDNRHLIPDFNHQNPFERE